MSIRVRGLIVSAPGVRGVSGFEDALKTAGFDTEVLSIDQLLEARLDQEQLCAKYRLVILPGGNSYNSVLGGGRALAIKIQYALRWNLLDFVARGGFVLGVGTGFQSLVHLKVFGSDFSFRVNDRAQYRESWVRVTPIGNRSVWLRGLGTLEFPINQMDTIFVIDPASYVEALGRLQRLGLNCLMLEGANAVVGNGETTLGLCDQTGRILGMMPHPEFCLSWTHTEDWLSNSTRAAAPGQGLALFENVMKASLAET